MANTLVPWNVPSGLPVVGALPAEAASCQTLRSYDATGRLVEVNSACRLSAVMATGPPSVTCMATWCVYHMDGSLADRARMYRKGPLSKELLDGDSTIDPSDDVAIRPGEI